MSKTCKRCFEEKTMDMFYKTNNKKAYPDGRIGWCKSCVCEYQSKRKKKPEFKKIDYSVLNTKTTEDEKPLFYIETGKFIVSFD